MGLINLWRKLSLNKLVSQAVNNPELLKSSKWWKDFIKAFWGIREVRILLTGYKSYIVAVLAASVTALHALGYIDDALFQTLMGLLGAGAVGTVAAKINRINPK